MISVGLGSGVLSLSAALGQRIGVVTDLGAVMRALSLSGEAEGYLLDLVAITRLLK